LFDKILFVAKNLQNISTGLNFVVMADKFKEKIKADTYIDNRFLKEIQEQVITNLNNDMTFTTYLQMKSSKTVTSVHLNVTEL
jgi:hypothetical protein